MKILVIIPAYNEEKNIINSVKKIHNIKADKKYKIDYIIINDGSKDDTYNICKNNNFNVINLISNLGIGGAVQTGYKYAYYNNYDIAIQFDGDGQHDEKYILNLVNEIEKGYDMAIGSRFISNVSKFKSTKSRQFGIKILSFFIKMVSRKKIYDPTSGYRAVNRDVICFFANDYPVEYPEPSSSVEVLKAGFSISEIPVEMHERKYGKSSINLTRSIYYMISVCIAILIAGISRRRLR